VTSVAQDLIRKLLVVDPAKRLGASDSGGWHAVMSHPWFADIDWDKLVNKDVKPPKFASKVCRLSQRCSARLRKTATG
jgi:serine/threonine protein kinase